MGILTGEATTIFVSLFRRGQLLNERKKLLADTVQSRPCVKELQHPMKHKLI